MNYSIAFRTAIMLVLVTMISLGSVAQSNQVPKPRWVSDKGYWVIETHTEGTLRQVIHFYNNDNQLVYDEVMEGLVVKASKRNVKMKLKKILETSVASWELNKQSTENLALVSSALR